LAYFLYSYINFSCDHNPCPHTLEILVSLRMPIRNYWNIQ
jgi:hypothetical protein